MPAPAAPRPAARPRPAADASGSSFTIHLPGHGVTPAPAPDRAPDGAPRGNGQAVLLVDDEEALVRLGEELLAELGYEPVGYTASAAALEAFRAEPGRFDALLSDESMPGLTGSELAAEVRRLRPELPIVLMSGFVSPSVRTGRMWPRSTTIRRSARCWPTT